MTELVPLALVACAYFTRETYRQVCRSSANRTTRRRDANLAGYTAEAAKLRRLPKPGPLPRPIPGDKGR